MRPLVSAKEPGPEPPPLFGLQAFGQSPALRPLRLQLRYQPVPLRPRGALRLLRKL